MTEQPLVCICIPTYNAAATLRETLASILSQTYRNLVVRIVDNASTDRTREIAEAFGDPRVSILVNETNIGPENNFSRCLQLGTGKYTAVFHADDIYEPGMVEQQVACMEADPEIGAVFTEGVVIDQAGERTGRQLVVPGTDRPADGVHDFQVLLKRILKHSNYLLCPTAMARTAIYRDEIVEWRGSLFRSSADLDVWLRIARRHPVAVLYRPLIRYRVSTEQGSHRLIRLRTERADFFGVMDHYLALPEVRALLNDEDMMHYRWLERTDRIVRATNLFAEDRFAEAAALLKATEFSDALSAAMQTRRGFFTFCGWVFLYVASRLGMHKAGKFMIHNLRRYIQK